MCTPITSQPQDPSARGKEEGRRAADFQRARVTAAVAAAAAAVGERRVLARPPSASHSCAESSSGDALGDALPLPSRMPYLPVVGRAGDLAQPEAT